MSEYLKDETKPGHGVRISNTLGKMRHYLSSHNSICISISGGSDSDIILHMVATYFREYLNKIHFVFSNTGIEYRATLKHLDDLEKIYDVEIQRVMGVPIPTAIKKFGVPFLSKDISKKISVLQHHQFLFSCEDDTEDFELLNTRYQKCSSSLKWWCNQNGEKSRFNISNRSGLKECLVQADFIPRISADCCRVSKKTPMLRFEQSMNADLVITGERKSEGGIRSTKYKSCYGQRDGMDHYMPLFFWEDDTKAYYKQTEGIVYSDCYEKYGLQRTGCVGCPFAQNRKEELEIMKHFEPSLYRACMNIFGDAYRLEDQFKEVQKELRQAKERERNENHLHFRQSQERQGHSSRISLQ